MENTTKSNHYTRLQMTVIIGGIVAYCCAYMGRLNLSASLAGIMKAISIDEAAAGSIQTVFAVVYAAGQFINGSLADRMNPKKIIVMGLVGSAVCNTLFALAGTYPLMLLLWGINGIFQSMLWTPLLCMIEIYFEKPRQKAVSFLMTYACIGGHFLAWAVTGALSSFGWQICFLTPAVIMVLGAVFSVAVLPKTAKRERRAADPSSAGATEDGRRMPIPALVFTTGLLPVLGLCILYGFLRDGVITWTPTILSGLGSGGLSDSAFSLIVPVINLAGLLLGRWLSRGEGRNNRRITGLMIGVCVVPSMLLYLCGQTSIALTAGLLGLFSMVMYGASPILTALVPLEYDKAGRVGLAAGLIDCFVYVGSAFAGGFTGYLRGAFGGWGGVYLCWGAVCILGLLFALLSVRGMKKLQSS